MLFGIEVRTCQKGTHSIPLSYGHLYWEGMCDDILFKTIINHEEAFFINLMVDNLPVLDFCQLNVKAYLR